MAVWVKRYGVHSDLNTNPRVIIDGAGISHFQRPETYCLTASGSLITRPSFITNTTDRNASIS